MAERDDKGPMQDPRTTRDVMKAAPPEPTNPEDKEPDAPATDAATHDVRTGQEDA